MLFSGPPIDREKDSEIVKKIMSSGGKKIVCGGTTANIVARELNVEYKSSNKIIEDKVPPIGYIEGVDLVTEGVVTLTELRKIFKSY